MNSHSPLSQNPSGKQGQKALQELGRIFFSKKITHRTLAKQIGVSRTSLEDWLTGRRPIPSRYKEPVTTLLLETYSPVPALLNALKESVKVLSTESPNKRGVAVTKRQEKIARDNGKLPDNPL